MEYSKWIVYISKFCIILFTILFIYTVHIHVTPAVQCMHKPSVFRPLKQRNTLLFLGYVIIKQCASFKWSGTETNFVCILIGWLTHERSTSVCYCSVKTHLFLFKSETLLTDSTLKLLFFFLGLFIYKYSLMLIRQTGCMRCKQKTFALYILCTHDEV